MCWELWYKTIITVLWENGVEESQVQAQPRQLSGLPNPVSKHKKGLGI